jgi:hypothetical protein
MDHWTGHGQEYGATATSSRETNAPVGNTNSSKPILAASCKAFENLDLWL